VISVLIVDDDNNILKMLDFAFQQAGFNVVVASNGREGLTKASERPPDVAVVDVMMPGVTGYELCRRLRANPNTAHVKVIFLTARSQPMDEQEGLKAGADLFLSKPVMPDELIAKIESLLTTERASASATGPLPPIQDALPTPHVEQLAQAVQPAPSEQQAKGRFVVCFSRQPGVGVTTLATNLALALALSRRTATPLVELHAKPSDLWAALGMSAGAPYGDLMATGSVLDWDALNLHLIDHPSGVRILPAPPPDSDVPPALTRQAIELFCDHFPVTVADAASEADSRVQVALMAADLVLLVVVPEVSAIRASLSAMHELRTLGVSEQRMLLVVNHIRPQSSIPVERIQEGMKRPILGIIPYESEAPAVAKAGRPLILARPRSQAALAIAQLTQRLVRVFKLP
jgi:pilus assembly protein CpaE